LREERATTIGRPFWLAFEPPSGIALVLQQEKRAADIVDVLPDTVNG